MMKVLYRYCVMTESLMKDYANFRERHFTDRVKLVIKGGHGGKGCVTYHRDRIVRTGGPDGGSGGNGGDVYFKAVKSLYDLNHFKKPNYEGNRGGPGQKAKKDGKNGGDLKLSVPVGTLVYEIKGVDESDTRNKFSGLKKELLIDLDYDGRECLVARGGRGSKGNANNIGIKEALPGEEGVEKQIYLELRCLADVGLVGFPNAGKSTFLASVSRALPKIAEYPFTTLNPMIGKVRSVDKKDFTIADIPGIIEEAHKDKGLGIEFLRHVERTKVIVYMIDISQQGPEYIEILRREIEHYNPEILKKPFIIVANKQDLEAKSQEKFRALCDLYGEEKCFLISSKHGYNVGDVVVQLKNMVHEIKEQEQLISENKKAEANTLQMRRQLLEKELFIHK